jgi:hypothetical protein
MIEIPVSQRAHHRRSPRNEGERIAMTSLAVLAYLVAAVLRSLVIVGA